MIPTLNFISKTAAETDYSLSVLEDLLGQGYNTLVFRAHDGADDVCIALDGDTKGLEEWIASLMNAAPLYEWSHPNCQCSLAIGGPGLPNVLVRGDGSTEEF